MAKSKRVGLIIARGGSKRVPKKNIRDFAGVGPMISLPIRALLRSGVLDDLYVDTDSEEIAAVAEQQGASVPYLRNPLLASDTATTLEVVQEATKRLGLDPSDTLLVAYPTNFLKPSFYIQAFDQFDSGKPTMLVSIVRANVVHGRLLRTNLVTGDLEFIDPKNHSARSQDLEETLQDAGKFYLARVDHWTATEHIFWRARPFFVPPAYGIDLDTEEDWEFAEIVYRGLKVQERHEPEN